MRAVFVGAGSLSVMCARLLLERGHEVVIVESDKERIKALSAELDCGYLHGDGTKPAILGEAAPTRTHVLFCLTGNDQTNIITSLVGRSLGFERVVTKISDVEFEHICIELGLKDTIIPSRTIAGYLADMFQGLDPLEISGVVKGEARVFSFVAREEDAGPAADLKLPEDCRIACVYRDGEVIVSRDDPGLAAGDEVVVFTRSETLPALQERFAPRPASDQAPADAAEAD